VVCQVYNYPKYGRCAATTGPHPRKRPISLEFLTDAHASVHKTPFREVTSQLDQHMPPARCRPATVSHAVADQPIAGSPKQTPQLAARIVEAPPCCTLALRSTCTPGFTESTLSRHTQFSTGPARSDDAGIAPAHFRIGPRSLSSAELPLLSRCTSIAGITLCLFYLKCGQKRHIDSRSPNAIAA
jgi:hypothetical protein